MSWGLGRKLTFGFGILLIAFPRIGLSVTPEETCTPFQVRILPVKKEAASKSFDLQCAPEGQKLRITVRAQSETVWKGAPKGTRFLDKKKALTFLVTPTGTTLASIIVEGPAPEKKPETYSIIRHEALPASSPSPERKFTWQIFRASLTGIAQSAGGGSTSVQLSWAPRFAWKPNLGLRGNLSASVFKGVTSLYLATELGALAELQLGSRWSAAAGIGLQTWWGFGGAMPMGSVEAAWKLPRALVVGKQQRVVAHYSLVLDSTNLTHQWKLGWEVEF